VKKNIVLVLILLFSISAPIFAESVVSPTQVAIKSSQFCPVSGDKASGKVTYIYQGKTYSFCCRKCLKDFKKNPEKYINSTPPPSARMNH